MAAAIRGFQGCREGWSSRATILACKPSNCVRTSTAAKPPSSRGRELAASLGCSIGARGSSSSMLGLATNAAMTCTASCSWAGAGRTN